MNIAATDLPRVDESSHHTSLTEALTDEAIHLVHELVGEDVDAFGDSRPIHDESDSTL